MEHRFELINDNWWKFFDYCKSRNTEKVDSYALYVKIAAEFKGLYHCDEKLDRDVIDFETSEDLLRFKLQFL